MNKEEPFELISDEEAQKISQINKEKSLFQKLFSTKTLIIIIFALVFIIVSTVNRHRQIQEEYGQPTMDALYENLVTSMNEEDIIQISELTSKAVHLLPIDEQEKLIRLQTIFGKEGYSALTVEETILMQELNNKATSLLPEEDKIKLDALMKKAYDVMTK